MCKPSLPILCPPLARLPASRLPPFAGPQNAGLIKRDGLYRACLCETQSGHLLREAPANPEGQEEKQHSQGSGPCLMVEQR